MNDEIRLLRDALEACLEVLPELDSAQSQAARKQAEIALQTTSGRLPKGYEVVKWPASYYVKRQGDYVLAQGEHASFDTEFAARLFCWQHVQEQRGEV